MARSRALAFVIEEIREILPPTLFFAGGFTLIELTTQLMLDDYFLRLANFVVAIGAALLVGKAVLLANRLPFLRRFDRAPLFRPILFKAFVYSLAVLAVRLLEKLIEYWIEGGVFGGFPKDLTSHITWHRFAAIQLWVFVLFVIYTGVSEVNARLGRGELAGMLFTRQAAAKTPHGNS